MGVAVFDKRIQPSKIGGLPEPVFFFLPAAFAMLVIAVLIPMWVIKIAFFIAGFGSLFYAWHVWRMYDDWLIISALESGQKSKDTASFYAPGKRGYMDTYFWHSYSSESTLTHSDGAYSLAFTWEGTHDRYFNDDQFEQERRRRNAVLKTLPATVGLFVENHLLRSNDTKLIDAYLKEGEIMAKARDVSPIALDIRQRLADLYRPLARSNRVLTVLSVGIQKRHGLTDYLLPSTYKQLRNSADIAKTLSGILNAVSSSYPGIKILTHDAYVDLIQEINRPYEAPHKVDWRFALSPQLITEKPVQDDDGCLVMGDTYYKCCLIQNYPTMSYGWLFRFCEASVDLHAVQILSPIETDTAIDKNKKKSIFETSAVSQRKGTEKAIGKIQAAAAYRDYVTKHGLSVANNAYILTFFSKDKAHVLHYADAFKKDVIQNDGLVRDNLDLQLELFRIRLPGQGRYSTFLREDHADTLSVMAPFTTFPHGVENPESLRISSTGQLVGASPSKLEVPHELVVAETNGGKDTQFGCKLIETYPRIRYDIIELGNSYQGAIEAIGGRYCRAREEIINPLAPFEEYAHAKQLTEEGAGRIDVDFIRTQSDLLTPIFKGMKGTSFTKPEEAVVNRLIKGIYENPVEGHTAPTLPFLLDALNDVETASEQQKRARDELGEEIFEFLETATGSCFKERDQFQISPIANGIDFDKFSSGDLFDYYMMFITIRMVTAAMARGVRSQIVLNEFKVLLERAPVPIRWITLTIDRMGRKDWVGLSRITQGLTEIQSIDPEALNSIPNKTLLSRQDSLHDDIGGLLRVPTAIVNHWKAFKEPRVMNTLGYREGILCESGQWHKLYLKFPPLLLDLMNTRADDKALRDRAYRESSDPYERISILNALQKERDHANS